MLRVIPQIYKSFFENSDGNNMKQINNVIKTLFQSIPEDDMNYTIDKFWNEYTNLNNKNGTFDSDGLIWKNKDIQNGNSHLWYHKYSLIFTKVLGFVAYRVT